MESIEYVGFDVHKKTVAFCAKKACGEIVDEGTIRARRKDLTKWAKSRTKPWVGGMEATMFSGWIYDTLVDHCEALKVGQPLRIRSIVNAKKKSDRLDARQLADLLRCNLFPECWMPSPKTRELRRMLRYRNLLVRESTRLKNRASSMLMEMGEAYNKERLHGTTYFNTLLESVENVPDSVIDLLKMNRAGIDLFQQTQRRLIQALKNNAALKERVNRLMTIPAVGEVTALTWAVEIDDPFRFPSIDTATSYCGLCSGQNDSAEKSYSGPISKQRNKYLQHVLVEAGKLAPRYSPQLAEVHARALERGSGNQKRNRNRATLEVARKLVAYLMAVDRGKRDFVIRKMVN